MEDCSHLDKELGELHRQKETILSQEKVDEDEVVAIDSRIAESLSAKQRDAFQNEIGDMLSVAKIFLFSKFISNINTNSNIGNILI